MEADEIYIANGKEFLTVKEAAKELEVKEQTIRDYLFHKILKTYKFKTLTLISKKEVEERKKRL
jgi:excisionase family DNA binding protein